MNRTSSRQRGFTVIEILIATSIFAVIMIAALLMYDRSNKVFKSGVEAADVQQNTRVAFDKIVADLRMAGFDFDRDGTPTTANAHQQPDEQIEFIHQRAITVRANFDYNDDPTANDHGREFTSTPGSTGLESINFPVVTTGNDEIVTYALVSNDASKNTGSITFYADVPDRKSHPEAGGRSENLVTIGGVDLTGANPPYTLERITLNPSTSSITPLIRYPIATNIRDMQFEYFEDQVGTDPLTDLSGNVIAAASYGTTVGGLGQYNPTSSAALPAKLIRGKVQSIKLVLIGQTENPDPTYTDATDAVAPRYRKYRLESLIVPRNYGRRGFREQDYVEPDAPVITKVCIGYCGVAWVEWDQPATGGAAEDYQVRYDTSPTGSFSGFEQAGLTTGRFVVLDDPSASYFFQVSAVNSYGSATSPVYPPGVTGLSAMNNTTPNMPSLPVATGGVNEIRLDWTAPTTFASGSVSCSPSGSAPTNIPVGEFAGFSVARLVDSTDFTPDPTNIVYDASTETPGVKQALPDPITFAAHWTDKTTGGTIPMGPVNCKTYYYRIRTQENCTLPAENTGNDIDKARSAGWTDEVSAMAQSDDTPAAPGSLSVDETNSVCNDPLASGDGYCNVHLVWAKTLLDEQGDPISISEYTIYRQKYNRVSNAPIGTEETIPIDFTSTPCVMPLDPTDVDCTAYEADPNYMTYVIRADSRVDPLEVDPLQPGYEDVYYDYWVTAKQCASDESPDSPTARYPCNFAAPTVTGAMTGVIEGQGTQASPWLIEPTSVFSIDTGGVTVDSFTANVILPDSSRSLLGTAPSGTSGSWGWADLGDGIVYTIEVTIKDLGGCTKNFYYYVEETSSNCCLMPVNIETRLLQEDGPGQKTRVRLRNLCSETLNITNIRIAWDGSLLLGGGPTRLDSVVYPTALGACPTVAHAVSDNSSTTDTAPPGGALATLAPGASSAGLVCGTTGSDDYEIVINFSKSYDPLAPVVTQVCVTYSTASDPVTTTQCQILPGVSTTAGTCDTP